MDDALHSMLAGWHDFYLITGTAAAALTGLQFVVQTLIASGDARTVIYLTIGALRPAAPAGRTRPTRKP